MLSIPVLHPGAHMSSRPCALVSPTLTTATIKLNLLGDCAQRASPSLRLMHVWTSNPCFQFHAARNNRSSIESPAGEGRRDSSSFASGRAMAFHTVGEGLASGLRAWRAPSLISIRLLAHEHGRSAILSFFAIRNWPPSSSNVDPGSRALYGGSLILTCRVESIPPLQSFPRFGHFLQLSYEQHSWTAVLGGSRTPMQVAITEG